MIAKRVGFVNYTNFGNLFVGRGYIPADAVLIIELMDISYI